MECKSTEHSAYVPKQWKNPTPLMWSVHMLHLFTVTIQSKGSTIATLEYLKWRTEHRIPLLAVLALLHDGK